MHRLEKLIGSELEFPVQHRILNIILLLGISLALISVFFFTIFAVGTVPFLVSASCFTLFLSLYYISILRKHYLITAYLLIVVFGFGVIPAAWLLLGGLNGGTPFFALAYVAMIAILLRGVQRTVVLSCFFLLLTGLTTLQILDPTWIKIPNIPSIQRILGKFFGLSIAMVAVIAFFIVILDHYIKEYQRSRDYLAKLEKQKIELELSRLDRLNMVGEMAASIGHEVRNPLTTVRGYLQLFQKQFAFSGYEERFAVMIGELDRANQIISEFLSLAKNKTIHLQPDNLNRIIGNLFMLIQADALLLGKHFVIHLGDVPNFPLDENEIRQCILNLVRNGFEATGIDGSVMLSTYTAGNEAILSVKDNGHGIPTEVYAKLGTPFVTTKEQGTGLGLPVCYRIVERHQAKLEVETGPAGTTFCIRFPLSGAAKSR